VISALGAVAAVRVGLTALSFARLKGVLHRFAGPGGTSGRPTASVDDVAWSVGAAARLVPRASCLVQALALELLLLRSGQPAELRIGVAREDGGLKAHAWIEADGRRFLEDPETGRFAALPPVRLS
jgi:hypothetical protein